MSVIISPGMRVRCRDAEWLVTRKEPSNRDHTEYAVFCIGVDDLVRGHEACFLTQLDVIEPVDPAKTILEIDQSPGCRKSRLFVEARLRQMPAAGLEPNLDGMGVFDPMDFQIDTVRHALSQLRPRLLLADAVGLGKTIQVGMVLTELMRRGRASRILVLAKKSMLTQFQSELWNRFAIPLVRLDSEGIARLRLQIPANKNPFDVYHRIIISIDTLKNVARYEHFLKKSRWDVVVIDEAHNVAGASNTERHLSYRLARLLSAQSSSMLLTTATPHNGKRETFGRLISLLDPSVIPDPRMQKYEASDISSFFKMRFKEDIRAEAGNLLSDREVIPLERTTRMASSAEESVYELIASMRSEASRQRAVKDGGRHDNDLIAYGLYKLFLSSPEACRSTTTRRLAKLHAEEPNHSDIEWLNRLAECLNGQSLPDSTRFLVLLDALAELKWDGGKKSPRLLIFTESRLTQDALAIAIADRFDLKFSAKFEDQPNQSVAVIHGGFPDIHITKTVEAFATGTSPIRMMIATDVASEGINLHHQCHHIIHYDIPWSIITLVQRNGRIDRLGQKSSPQIRYLMVNSTCPNLSGDSSIFERLVVKVEEINRLRQSGESVLRLYDSEREEQWIGEQGFLHNDTGVLDRSASQSDRESNELEQMLREAQRLAQNVERGASCVDRSADTSRTKHHATRLRFYSDRDFLIQGYRQLAELDSSLLPSVVTDETITLPAPADLKRRLGAPGTRESAMIGALAIPQESWPVNGEFRLTQHPHRVKLAIEAARNTSGYWASELLCSEQHPVLHWLTERMIMQMDRGVAPIVGSPHIPNRTLAFCFSGLVSSSGGAPLVSEAHAIVFRPGGAPAECRPLDQVMSESRFAQLMQSGPPPDRDAARLLLSSAVKASQMRMKTLRDEYEKNILPLIRAEEARLQNWLDARIRILEEYAQTALPAIAQNVQKRIAEAKEYAVSRNRTWREFHYETSADPSVQLLLVIAGTGD